MTKQVVATGVIVRGEEPGISGNRLTGSLGTSPKITHIKPGTIFLVEDDAEYRKLKKMRVIQDYIPALGNPAKRIEQFFGAEDTEAKSDVVAAAEAALEQKRQEEEAAAEAARVKNEAEAKDRARLAAQNARAAELAEEQAFADEQARLKAATEGTAALGSTDTGVPAGNASDPDTDKKAKAAAARAAREQKAADKAAKEAADKAAAEAGEDDGEEESVV